MEGVGVSIGPVSLTNVRIGIGLQMENELKQLESLGLVLPTPAYLLGAILFGIAGYVAWRRGRNMNNPMLKWTGLALMLYPYAVAQTWLLFVFGIALCFWVYWNW